MGLLCMVIEISGRWERVEGERSMVRVGWEETGVWGEEEGAW